MSSKSITLGEVKVGDELPELAIDITSSLIVGGAIASNDYTPVHHDKAAAQASGMQDVFMNILTTGGLVGRFVSDWAGVDAELNEVVDQRHHRDRCLCHEHRQLGQLVKYWIATWVHGAIWGHITAV